MLKFEFKGVLAYLTKIVKGLVRRCQSKEISQISTFSLNLDPAYAYVLLHASFGDKWLILSFFHEFLVLQPEVRIIAKFDDYDILRIFISKDVIQKRVIFIEDEILDKISNQINPLSQQTQQLWYNVGRLDQTEDVIKQGFPLNTIRHLHTVKYPYFCDLQIEHGVTYATLLRMLLYLPSGTKPQLPKFYSSEDISTADELLFSVRGQSNRPIVLFNLVNFSHLPLSLEQVLRFIYGFEHFNIQVIINVAQMSDLFLTSLENSEFKYSKLVKVPGHLLALLSEKADGVIGVLGGAMNVAAQFSKTHCISLHTTAVGFPHTAKTIFGGKYSENLWLMYEEDWETFIPGRIIKNVDVGDPKNLTENMIDELINDMAIKVRA